MGNTRKTVERVDIRVRAEQKNQLKRKAAIANKTLSEYVRDAALASTLDSAKQDFYETINSNQAQLAKSVYIVTRLMLLITAQALGSEERAMEYYHSCVSDAEKKF